MGLPATTRQVPREFPFRPDPLRRPDSGFVRRHGFGSRSTVAKDLSQHLFGVLAQPGRWPIQASAVGFSHHFVVTEHLAGPASYRQLDVLWSILGARFIG